MDGGRASLPLPARCSVLSKQRFVRAARRAREPEAYPLQRRGGQQLRQRGAAALRAQRRGGGGPQQRHREEAHGSEPLSEGAAGGVAGRATAISEPIAGARDL
jgi:hypothetical protein